MPRMTDQAFAELCAGQPGLFFEMTAHGELVITPPTHSKTGTRNSRISGQLDAWAWEDGTGIATESSTGFVLPNGARRSPDAAWVPQHLVDQLPIESQDGYWHLCPTFVIELRSDSDRMPPLRDKMREYIENGAQLGWLIDPESRTVEIYRPGRMPELLSGADSIRGEGPVDGFVMDLGRIWNPRARQG